MKIQIFPDADEVARAAAQLIGTVARAAIAERGKFVVAFSGGKGPWQMLRNLAGAAIPWKAVHVFQVDERVCPPDDPDRNFKHLQDSLLSQVPLEKSQIYPMPVDDSDLSGAARSYARTMRKVAGDPVRFDLIHLGLGPDGHTASLVPGDPVLEVTDSDIGLTGVYQNRNRMTLTYPVLNRAHNILWLVTGDNKQDALVKLVNSDPSIPAGRVHRDNANLVADEAAALKLEREA